MRSDSRSQLLVEVPVLGDDEDEERDEQEHAADVVSERVLVVVLKDHSNDLTTATATSMTGTTDRLVRPATKYQTEGKEACVPC